MIYCLPASRRHPLAHTLTMVNRTIFLHHQLGKFTESLQAALAWVFSSRED
jgi:hypothetical protein